MKRRIKVFFMAVAVILTFTAISVNVSANTKKARISYSTISLNTTITGKITERWGEKYYCVNVPQNGYINVDFSHDYIDDSGNYWNVKVYDSSMGEEWAEEGIGARDMNTSMTKIGVTAGRYYIKVEGNYDVTTGKNYRLKVNYTASGNWETEKNDEYNMADLIPVNQTINGTSMNYGDIDYFKINIAKQGYIHVNFNHNYVNDSGNYWYITIYNNEMKELTKYGIEARTTKINLTKIGLPAGSYYIKVEGNYDETVGIPYQFIVNYTTSSSWETEFNDTYDAADNIGFGQTKYGTSMNYGDEDYYRLKASATGYLSLLFKNSYKNDSGYYWYVTIYDSYMRELREEGINVNKTTRYLPKVRVNGGKYYYIKIAGNYDETIGIQYNIKPVYSFTNTVPNITSLKSKKNKAYLKWRKVTGASGYEIYMSKGNTKHYKKIKTIKGTKYTKTKLTKKKKYYFKIRAYKYVNGKKNYSSFGKSKKVTIK